MAKFSCDQCTKSFQKQHGLAVHTHRMHTAAGKTWGTNQASTNSGSSARAKIRRVLAEHPEGLQIQNIITKLKGIGYHPSGDASTSISQACSNDTAITRVERGIYRLKSPPTPEVAKTPESVTTQEEVVHSTDALLVRIEHLESERNALRSLVAANTHAQLAFVREVGA